MAKSRKQQRTAKGAVANAAKQVNETVIDAAKATTKVAETYVVEPAKTVLGPAKKKPAKKRHVRPARPAPTVETGPLTRGTSIAARTMSAGVAKGIVAPTPTGSTVGITRLKRPQSMASGSIASDSTSSRSIRRLARRRASES
jgi:hypothetical protein